jgi:hypothetical protein
LWDTIGFTPYVISDTNTNYKYISEYATEQILDIDMGEHNNVDNSTNFNVSNMVSQQTLRVINDKVTPTNWLGNDEGENIIQLSADTFKLDANLVSNDITIETLVATDSTGRVSRYIETVDGWLVFQGDVDINDIIGFIHIENDVFYFTKLTGSSVKISNDTLDVKGIYSDIESHNDKNQNSVPDKFEIFGSSQSNNSATDITTMIFEQLQNKIYNITNPSYNSENELYLLFTEYESPEEIINQVETFEGEFNIDEFKHDNSMGYYCGVDDSSIVLKVNKIYDISEYDKLMLTVDSKNHYPFQVGVKGTVVVEFIK